MDSCLAVNLRFGCVLILGFFRWVCCFCFEDRGCRMEFEIDCR